MLVKSPIYAIIRAVFWLLSVAPRLATFALVPAPFLKDPKGIRDIEEWYVSTVIRQDFIRQIFQQQTDIALQNLAKLWETVGDRVDALFICGTDFGTQNSTFCSEETYRELYMPYYRGSTIGSMRIPPGKLLNTRAGLLRH
jgi:hypothetical protein